MKKILSRVKPETFLNIKKEDKCNKEEDNISNTNKESTKKKR
jgi:hypothetical protein